MTRIKILAVDDEANVLKIVSDTFPDYDLTTEKSSVNAVELIQKEKFDIFIVDFQMPQMDGIKLLEEIKREYTGRQYIAILCTAYGTIHLFKHELVRGLFTFYLEKPFEIDSLKLVVMKAVATLKKIRTGEKQPVTIS